MKKEEGMSWREFREAIHHVFPIMRRWAVGKAAWEEVTFLCKKGVKKHVHLEKMKEDELVEYLDQQEILTIGEYNLLSAYLGYNILSAFC
ncbi:hypothetical protein AKJ41_02035 [candidate division MSBL1 archaeon SCGC-AAA259O05]|uniref:Uncharacterized protein n=1 Tax=candidate division MSBL1 archaeon SCGC-AAA259O05 TaxID=1698271 RepID=A0A133V4D8_9EURY|nr:hypothetical protein AKJ41_02035 [candidate division MSBL1 archaeon SCGC-AAA259O05]